jgi:methionyl-tRNA formyltransferase
MSELSIVILCGGSPRHWYVANRLCRAARPLAIVQESGRELNARKVARMLRPDNFARKVWRWVRDRRRYSSGAEARFFFGGDAPRLERPELVVEVPHINHASVVELVDRTQPDLIFVFGTSLIRGALLEKGRLGIVNLHGGLSPQYRGADCTFWALYNGEPDRVGCTLHFIDAGIDTGALIAHVCPEVGPGDDELTLFWRGVRDSADAAAELLERMGRGERPGERQREKGRLYQVKQRGYRHERDLDARMRAGMLDAIHLPPRVRWFAGSDGAAGKDASARAPEDSDDVRSPRNR